MTTIDTVVIGAGHAGLAVSRLLTRAGHDHVVLDRGRVGERWRSERWDSLHLLTPNWMTRLPGWFYGGPDPEGFLSAHEVVRLLERYADAFDAPVVDGTTVLRVEPLAGADAHDGSTRPRYRVVTDGGTVRCRNIVVATGPHGTPYVPEGLATPEGERWETGAGQLVLTSNRYRHPGLLPAGGVLVVGASSSGTQIADELNRAGRDVVLAVGRHTRMPRRYRGMDAFWWLDATGRLSRTIDTMPDPAAARHEPSMQLVGRNDLTRDLDLGTLQGRGVRLAGRLLGTEGRVARFAGGLADDVADADRRMSRFLDTVDDYVDRNGLTSEVWPAVRPRPVVPAASADRMDLRAEGIGTVLLAAGYRPDHHWLRLPVTAPDGSIVQRRGVTAAPGVYVVGQRFQHRRDSGFIDGARHDAHAVVTHLLAGSGHAPQAVETASSERPAS
jgi:putative flavoprotein involved in K+ transport